MSRTTTAVIAALAAATLTLAGCGAASSATGVTAPPPTGQSGPTQATATTPAATQPATLTDSSSAEQIGAALGCTGWQPHAVQKNSMGPTALSEGSCQMGGHWYGVTQYKNQGDLDTMLILAKALVAGIIRKPWTFGIGDNWLVSAGKDGSASSASLSPDMVAALQSVGGVTKTINPSGTL